MNEQAGFVDTTHSGPATTRQNEGGCRRRDGHTSMLPHRPRHDDR